MNEPVTKDPFDAVSLNTMYDVKQALSGMRRLLARIKKHPTARNSACDAHIKRATYSLGKVSIELEE